MDGSGETTSSSVTVPTGSQFSSNISKSDVGDRSCATGVGGHIASISCWMRRSQSERIGTACRGCGAVVGNSFLMTSSTVSRQGGKEQLWVQLNHLFNNEALPLPHDHKA